MPELLAYFALSIVKDPQSNPTFSKIFSREWVMELRNQLLKFIDSMYSPTSEPFLVQLYQNYREGKLKLKEDRGEEIVEEEERRGSDGEGDSAEYERKKKDIMQYVQELESNNKELVDIVMDFNEKYKQMEREVERQAVGVGRDDSTAIQKKWATFSKEILKLTKSVFACLCESSAGFSGEKKIEFETKIQEYDEFLTLNMNDLMMERQTPPARNPRPFGARDQKEKDQYSLRHTTLDFGKIKGFFLSDSNEAEEAVVAILGSIKKRIMRTDSVGRHQTILSIVHADMFGLSSEKTEEESIIARLLGHENLKIRYECLKVFNLMCTRAAGRGYLNRSEQLVELLIDILKREEGDTKIRRRSLGILQNLSLRTKPINMMINKDLVKFSFEMLHKEKDTLLPYSLDYITSLLMNLSLRSNGKRKFEEIEEFDILEILNDLLQLESDHVRTFVHGILFSILTSPKIKEKAVESNFLKRLEDLKQRVKPRFQKQIECIIEQCEKETVEDEQIFEEEDEDDNLHQDSEPVDEEDISIGTIGLFRRY